MQMQRSVFAVVLLIAAAGCSTQGGTSANAGSSAATSAAAPADAGAARQAIEAANAKFIDAMKRGDTATMAANYAEDAVVMMPNEGAWRGRAALTKGFSGFLSQMTMKDMKAQTQDVTVAGDLAVETGTYEMTMQPKTGKAVVDKGKYLTIWKRQADGSWKIIRDINNTDLPAKA